MKPEEPKSRPEPTLSEAIVAAEREEKAPTGRDLVPPVPLPIEVASALPETKKHNSQ